MANEGFSELVFTVEGSKARSLQSVEIADLQLLERKHLQEWVLERPEILGPDVLIITFEFDQWGVSSGAAPKDRLDVLGLGSDGRLVVAELKRGKSPDTVDLQAIKYAAMASRFDEDQLARLHRDFLNRDRTDETELSQEGASEKIGVHVSAGLSIELLASPRIVILAEGFSSTVTSSVVWLNEQGIDITLKQYRAYQTALLETIITVSQYYPVADVSAFEVSPVLRRKNSGEVESLPVVPWTEEDLSLVEALGFEVPIAILDLCSQRVGQWIGSDEAYQLAGVLRKSGMGKLAGFGYSVRRRFKRSNAPWTAAWAKGDLKQAYYSVTEELAKNWLAIRGELSDTEA